MANFGRGMGRALMLAVPVGLGVAVVLFAGKFKTLPEPVASNRPPALVRVITLEPLDLAPRVTGYGTVTPVREWRAVARVEGEIVQIAQPLAAGDVVAAGSLLFTLDDSDLKLQLANIDAQLAASQVKDQTVQASLAIARSDQDLARQDLARQEKLKAQGVVTQAQFETARRQELSAQVKVTELENQLALNAAEREVLATQAATIERSISYAKITAPYDLRVTELSADLGQYVSRGQALLSGEGVEAVDISPQFPIGRIGPLLRLLGEGTKVTDLKARVSLPGADHPVVWKAQVVRTGDAIDATTQSAPVVVRVAEPQGQSVAGERPPLRRNMVVEVELFAPKRAALVVPAEAVAGGTALVVREGVLAQQPVSTGFVSGDLAVVTAGLKAGDQLVITDPSIAMPGQAVKPVEDAARKAALVAEALGQAPAAAKPGSGAGKAGGGSGAGTSGGAAAPAGDAQAKPAAPAGDAAQPAADAPKPGSGAGKGSGQGKGAGTGSGSGTPPAEGTAQ